MITFTVLLIFLTLLEWRHLKNNKKNIFAYSILIIIAAALGFYYLSNPYEADLALHIFRLLGMSY